MESWKVNLISVWFGCFFTGLAISQILPFLPLYISQLGVSSHEALSMWSGLTFSITFLISAIVSPMWGSLADRKGRKLMLLRASLGMAIAILLQAFATHVWQLFLLRGIMGLTSGYIPNAMALVASQVPRERSGWALSTLSTAQISGVIGGPLMGGFVADHIGLRAVFLITAMSRVHERLNTLRLPGAPQVMLRISVGVAPLTPQIGHYREWLKSADMALYKAKNAGRNRTEVAA
ncbi:MFS transporter [Salmonella enterica]|uniref:MFS transporter n=1 Tax=Salmonella enterica TaxID=28901 RepID=A0A5V1IK25_SALER|nr:MFS transporter [Salmonella enterica]EBT1258705.1 MFS transporter [Salmonella enterica]EGX3558346.1 MFS transporter [Salmonella enterica subsp. enterica serovar 4,[5],12:i:-]